MTTSSKAYSPAVVALRALLDQCQNAGHWKSKIHAAKVLGLKDNAVADASTGKSPDRKVEEIAGIVERFLLNPSTSIPSPSPSRRSRKNTGKAKRHSLVKVSDPSGRDAKTNGLLMQLLRAAAREASQLTLESLKGLLPAMLADSIQPSPPSGGVISDPEAVLRLLMGDGNQTFATISERLLHCEILMTELIGHFDFLLAQNSNEVAAAVGQNLGPCIDSLYTRIAESLKFVETRAGRGLESVRSM